MRNTFVLPLARKPDEDAPALDQAEDRFLRPNHEFIVVGEGRYRTRRYIGDEEEVAVEHALRALMDAPPTDADFAYDQWLEESRSHQAQLAAKTSRSDRHRQAKRKLPDEFDEFDDIELADAPDIAFMPGPDDIMDANDQSSEEPLSRRKKKRKNKCSFRTRTRSVSVFGRDHKNWLLQ